jgi:hypothetical protein
MPAWKGVGVVTAPVAEAALPEVGDARAVGWVVDGTTPVACIDPPAWVVGAGVFVITESPVDTTGLLVEVGSTSVFDDFAELALVATDEFPFDAWFSSSSSQTAQVTIPGPLPPTSISRLARMRVIFPPATSLPTIVRRLSPFNATASMLPALLISNWRGRSPPAGNLWIKEMVPLEGEMRKVKRESEEILVLFLGSEFGIVKLLSLRELTIRYLLSGYCTSVFSSFMTIILDLERMDLQ